MKTTILILSILISGYGFSQEDFKRWKIGSSISYDGSMRGGFIYGSNGIAPGGCVVQEPAFDFDFTAGIVGQYSLTKRLEIGSGLAYSRKTDLESNYYFICGNGLICPPLIAIYAPMQNNFLEIPVFVRYNFLKTKFNFHVEAGTTGGMMLNENYFSSKYRLDGQAGLGISYTIADLINLSATTFYGRRLTDFDRNSIIMYPNSLSLEFRAAFIF